MMSDLVEFLRARLDEDEAVAREAVKIRERVYQGRFESDLTFEAWDDHPAGTVIVGPERVLREVEAKRALILAELSHVDDWEANYCYTCHDVPQRCPTLRTLAAVYADHPDYRDEWR